MKITPEQTQLFATEYLRTSNAPAAAQTAGINPRLAGKLIKDDAVKAEIEGQKQEAVAATGATGEHAELLRLANEAYTIAAAANNAAGMVAAAKLRADLTGALKAPAASQVTAKAEDLTDDDLARIIATCTCGALKKASTSKNESLPL
jgi:phage terminase small subunit